MNTKIITKNTLSPTATNPPTVAQMVIAAQNGDRVALGDLFERYRPTVVAAAMARLGDAHEAEELAQDVFVQAMLKIRQLRTPEAFGGWLRQIVHRMAINRITRRRNAAPCDPVTLEATCADDLSPESVAVDREAAVAVHCGIERLGRMDQQTLHAFYMDGQSLNEMSDRFDAPVGTIKRRLHTARKRLAKQLDDGDSDPMPAVQPASDTGSHAGLFAMGHAV
ncbi:MAG: sigma-70 family RNA polymerase sigma factor [Planctomycetota bacterium]